MKTVFRNQQEVAHAWAHQISTRGRTSNGNLYFNVNVIYSYGKHWPIAAIYNNHNLVVVNNETYDSATTRKHTSYVLRSIPLGYARIYVPKDLVSVGLTDLSSERISEVEAMTAHEINRLLESARRRRSSYWMRYDLTDIVDFLRGLKKLLTFRPEKMTTEIQKEILSTFIPSVFVTPSSISIANNLLVANGYNGITNEEARDLINKMDSLKQMKEKADEVHP